MYIKIKLRMLQEAMKFLPLEADMVIHNCGEYGEFIICLNNEEEEREEWFNDFLKYAKDEACEFEKGC